MPAAARALFAIEADENTTACHPDFGHSVRLSHGESLVGRNLIGVVAEDLCASSCDWCAALDRRIRSRVAGRPQVA